MFLDGISLVMFVIWAVVAGLSLPLAISQPFYLIYPVGLGIFMIVCLIIAGTLAGG